MSCHDRDVMFEYAQNASGGIVDITVKNSCDRQPINLTGASVKLSIQFPDDSERNAANVTILDALNGEVRWTLTRNETGLVGKHRYQVHVTTPTWEDVSDDRIYKIFDPILGPDVE